MTPPRLALIALALALPLAGCGKMGELERPRPMFGSRAASKAPPPTPSPPVATVDRRNLDPDDDIPELPAPGENDAVAPQ
jgi:hypothetical protein